MKKRWLILMVACWIFTNISGQTLFTYGKYAVSTKEFLRAYNKNNTAPVSDKAKALKEYLDLFINSKLKIQEARDRGYDTLPQIRSEVDNLRSQIIDNYMTDPDMVDKMVNEAFQRSQKDIHVAHIFISFINSDGEMDTVAARQKLKTIMNRLEKGDDFLKIAQQSSDDPSAKTNKGDIGFITVFTLPYKFENIVYSTAVGKFSAPYESKGGYHIFKNLGERKALGKIKARQILLAIPPGADETTQKEISRRADSLYERIQAGDDFGKLATEFSNDYVTAVNGGLMHDFSVGQFEPEFENMVRDLPPQDSVTKPFLTSYGYHIVKRIGVIPVITDPKNKENMQDLRLKIMHDQPWMTMQDAIYDRVIKKAGFKKGTYNKEMLWALTDSILDAKPLGKVKKIENETVLFKLGDSVLKVPNWISYAQTYRYKPDGSGKKPYDQVMDGFIHATEIQYYRDHLEDFNEEFRSQMNEFRDGNLFFEIMQREIWSKAQADSAALLKLYEKNKNKYIWKPSAATVIFFCPDQNTALLAYEQMKKDPDNWKKVADMLSEKLVTDSGRYEWSQIPGLNQSEVKPGVLTKMISNKNDNTASFAYILKVYPEPTPRTYEEAKGLVINDYQNMLEEKWVQKLKKKYPVVINKSVLASISK